MRWIVRLCTGLLCLAAPALGSSCETVRGDSQPAAEISAQPAAENAGAKLIWPRVFEEGGIRFSIYQPQIESWEGVDLRSRAAVAVEPLKGGATVYGIMSTSATTDVDKAAGLVTLRNLQVVKVTFPTAPDKEGIYLQVLRAHVPAVRPIALDHLEASFAISQAVKKAQIVPVKNDAPPIIFSTIPALLVLVDGAPVLRPIEGQPVERVLNTPALIVKVGAKLYLAAGKWYEAGQIAGPWTLSTMQPALLESVKQQARQNHWADVMDPSSGTTSVVAPVVYVSTVPAELIQADGKPQFVPIEGTTLLQVSNSDDIILLDLATNDFYALTSGRWFRSKSLEHGPWTFVAGKDLPADFANIPADHPRANALVSVPGTPQAQEAVIANSIPQTAEVDRAQARADVTYDGQPQFVSIQRTPLYYAVNCSTPVIEVSPRSYYCVQNGVWFAAPSPVGPWPMAAAPSAMGSPGDAFPIPGPCWSRPSGGVPRPQAARSRLALRARTLWRTRVLGVLP